MAGNVIRMAWDAACCRALARLPDRYAERLPDRAAVLRDYYRYLKAVPDLRAPKTFNEKINWRKLRQHDPRFTDFADKVLVKALIAEIVGEQYVIETLWAGTDPAAIPFGTLTPPYVIKTNHGCGSHVFVRAGAPIDEAAIIGAMAAQLKSSHGRLLREWGYLDIRPQVLVERMIEVPAAAPDDYKFFVYHGRVHFIQLDHDRQGAHRQNFYSRDWNPLPVRYVAPPGETVPAPPELEEMIRVAETIGRQFDFVRVDLYAAQDGVKFGEVTFYPNAGIRGFDPPEWDLKFGEPWRVGTGFQ